MLVAGAFFSFPAYVGSLAVSLGFFGLFMEKFDAAQNHRSVLLALLFNIERLGLYFLAMSMVAWSIGRFRSEAR